MSKEAKFTLANGKTYAVKPVNDTLINMARDGVRKRMIQAGEPIEPPKYKITLAGGAEEWVSHDATTIDTEEEKKLWNAHLEAVARMHTEQARAQSKAWLSGVVFELPEDDEWIERQRWIGVEIPENPLDLRWHYLMTEVLVTPDDYLRAIEAITRVSYEGALSEEDLQAAVNSFRSNIQRTKTANGNQTAQGQLAAQSKAAGTGDGESLGDGTESV